MENKGFGGAKSGSSQSAKQFILKFKKYWEANPDIKKAHQFFLSHLSALNESLLSSLPLIFRELTKNKKPQEQNQIAAVFGNFGYSLIELPLGDCSLNLELSITALQLILKVFTRNFFPKNGQILKITWVTPTAIASEENVRIILNRRSLFRYSGEWQYSQRLRARSRTNLLA